MSNLTLELLEKTYPLHLRTAQEIYEAACELASYFPQPDEFMTAIYELLLNAVEHGNLGIGLEEKARLIRNCKWEEEFNRRLQIPENTRKAVDTRLHRDESECRLTITDQGCGFAWRNHFGKPAQSTQPNGRGLWIVYNTRFDHVQFNPLGNQVTCIVKMR